MPGERQQVPSNVRRSVMLGLFLLSVITYLDRVCINSAAPEMQRDLGLSNAQWGMVVGAFLAAYGLFEVPGGWLGDRFGPRLILTRIVVWWSGFTALTGVVRNYTQLLIVRSLFGAGEAGAYPNTSCVVSRWFPPQQRARAQGIVFMASRLGGALSPLLVLPLIANWGWRSVFYVFSVLGIVWAVWWWKFFRDYPAEHTKVTDGEIAIIGAGLKTSGPRAPRWLAHEFELLGNPRRVPLLLLRLELVLVLDGELPFVSKGVAEFGAGRIHRPALPACRRRRLGEWVAK